MIPNQIWFIPNDASPFGKIFCPCCVEPYGSHHWFWPMKCGRTCSNLCAEVSQDSLCFAMSLFSVPEDQWCSWERLLYWPAFWNEDDVEQSYSWAMTDKVVRMRSTLSYRKLWRFVGPSLSWNNLTYIDWYTCFANTDINCPESLYQCALFSYL